MDAQAHLEQTLRIFDPVRDRGTRFRFGQDSDVGAKAYLVHVAWHLGEIGRAWQLVNEAEAHAAESAHAPTLSSAYIFKAIYEIIRGDTEAALRAANTVVALSREHGLAHYLAFGSLALACARAKLGARDAGTTEFRQALTDYAGRGNKFSLPFYQGLLAEIEADGGGADASLAGIDEALALAAQTGEHWFDAGLYRIRGKLLIRQNASDPASAEKAFLTAIAIAQAQKARSFGLRAALALAKLYRASGRDADAHAVLGPALEGFAPTPEFPEIEEAKALLDALSETDAVKAAAALRKQRVDLHAAYGSALLQGRGIHAPETKAAFERARELAAGDASRPQITFGLWAGAYARGELESMRAFADALQQEVADSPRSSVAGVAQRVLGVTKHYEGDFLGARSHLERALAIFDPARDGELASRFTADPGVLAIAYLAHVLWAIGEVDRARRASEDLSLRMSEVSDAGSLGYGHAHRAGFELTRGDVGRAAPHAKALAEIERDHEIAQWQPFCIFFEGWIECHVGDREAGLRKMRRGVAKFAEMKIALQDGLIKSVLAKAEADGGEIEAALSTIGSAIAASERTGQGTYDAEVHRTRGEILLKQNPADPTAAEDSFLAAIAIAQAQKTRSFQLRAALSLAKLYRAIGRDADAHAVLGPALVGFSPTPEFPETAKALAFMAGA